MSLDASGPRTLCRNEAHQREGGEAQMKRAARHSGRISVDRAAHVEVPRPWSFRLSALPCFTGGHTLRQIRIYDYCDRATIGSI